MRQYKCFLDSRVKYAVLFILALSAGNISAQNYKDDISAIYKNMRGAASYSMTLQYKLYVDRDFKKEFQSRSIEVMRLRNQLYMKQNNGVEVIDNPQYQLLADHKNKLMSVNKKKESQSEEEALKLINSFFASKIDTFLMMFEKINVLENNKTHTIYECIYKQNPSLVKMTVTIDRKQMMFKKVVTEYKDKRDIPELDNKKHTVAVEVSYHGFKTNCGIGAEYFNTARFISMDGKGKIKPLAKYSGYKFLSGDK